ncbi:PPM-type phosphatase domain-containing protein [Mucor velutinosus]|uniref:PPM-type phosphatase domain-containing protein n=1 Tax=Mucor velutinosus TaxID=708070 RepID=A0AAN7HQW0_9FUNG|nr:PPM-type phosphatase domain-containing protein [Mucor velutinosus]
MTDINLSGIKNIVLVLSGKGGVGKSSVTTQLALGLVHQGKKVGVLDIDLTGPSIPRMLGLDGKKVHQASQGWVPVYADENQRLSCMSIGFLLTNKNDSVVWRGPKKNAMIKQFLQDVYWGELDYLLIDTPPGTSDEHIGIVEYLKEFNPDGAVIVTTPQGVAIADVRKEVSFCKKVKLPILGVVENMSGFVCPHCAECTNIFSSGGGESMAKDYDIDFFGRVPIDPGFTSMVETEGSGSYVKMFEKSNLFPVFQQICDKVTEKVESNK